jgi:hypothetical protein
MYLNSLQQRRIIGLAKKTYLQMENVDIHTKLKRHLSKVDLAFCRSCKVGFREMVSKQNMHSSTPQKIFMVTSYLLKFCHDFCSSPFSHWHKLFTCLKIKIAPES